MASTNGPYIGCGCERLWSCAARLARQRNGDRHWAYAWCSAIATTDVPLDAWQVQPAVGRGERDSSAPRGLTMSSQHLPKSAPSGNARVPKNAAASVCVRCEPAAYEPEAGGWPPRPGALHPAHRPSDPRVRGHPRARGAPARHSKGPMDRRRRIAVTREQLAHSVRRNLQKAFGSSNAPALAVPGAPWLIAIGSRIELSSWLCSLIRAATRRPVHPRSGAGPAA